MMPERNILHSKRQVFAVVCVGLLLLVLVLLFRGSRPAPTIELSDLRRMPGASLDTTVDYKQGALFVSNGRYFVKYDTGTGVSQRLSTTNSLPKIHNLIVSPTAKYIAFEASGDIVNYNQFRGLSDGADDLSLRQWWLLNTHTKTFSYITTDSPALSWLDSDSFVYASGSEIFKQVPGKDATGSSTYTGAHRIDNLQAIGNSVYFSEKGSGVKVFNASTGESDTIGSSVTNINFSPKKAGCYFLGRDNDGEEVAHSLVGCTKRTLALPEEIYSTRFTNDGKYFFYVYNDIGRQNTLAGAYIEIETGKSGVWVLGEPFASSQDTQIVSSPNKSTIFVRVGDNYFGSSAKAIKLIDETTSDNIGGLYLDLVGGDNKVTVSREDDFTEQDYVAVDKRLRDMGYDPQVLDIRYTTITTDDNRWD